MIRLYDTPNETEIYEFTTSDFTFRSLSDKSGRFYKRSNKHPYKTNVIKELDLSPIEQQALKSCKLRPIYLRADHEIVEGTVSEIQETRIIVDFAPKEHPIWVESTGEKVAYALPRKASIEVTENRLRQATLRDKHYLEPDPVGKVASISGYLTGGSEQVKLQLSGCIWANGAVGSGVTFCHLIYPIIQMG